MLEISLRAVASPVTAVIVTQPEISVPALVMNCLAPFDDPLAALELGAGLGVAGVRAGLGLGQPEGGELLPAQSWGSQSSRCSSVPQRWMGIVPSEVWAAIVIATEESTRVSSSTASA